MARHRKIDVRMWGDAKFRSLSKPQPCAQFLWVYLLTGPHTTSIPGLFHAGEAQLAEALGWQLKGFREAFREVLRQGMAEADFESRVIWIPKAIFHNPPESKNVVKSWRAYWDEIPECELKVKAHKYVKAFLEGYGEGFSSLFCQVCATPSPNQEQEQEQEQEVCVALTHPEIPEEKKKFVFIKPTVEEVRSYCLERKNKVDPERFVNFYESKGWMVGKNPMKDWRASVRTWEQDKGNGVQQSETPKDIERKNRELEEMRARYAKPSE